MEAERDVRGIRGDVERDDGLELLVGEDGARDDGRVAKVTLLGWGWGGVAWDDGRQRRRRSCTQKGETPRGRAGPAAPRTSGCAPAAPPRRTCVAILIGPSLATVVMRPPPTSTSGMPEIVTDAESPAWTGSGAMTMVSTPRRLVFLHTVNGWSAAEATAANMHRARTRVFMMMVGSSSAFCCDGRGVCERVPARCIGASG